MLSTRPLRFAIAALGLAIAGAAPGLAAPGLTVRTGEILPLDNPHPTTDHWTRLWAELQNHPEGDRIRLALNELIPRTCSVVARKPA